MFEAYNLNSYSMYSINLRRFLQNNLDACGTNVERMIYE